MPSPGHRQTDFSPPGRGGGIPDGTQSGRVRDVLRRLRRDWQLYLMLAPAVIWFLLFLYKPMYGLQIAFKDYSIWGWPR